MNQTIINCSGDYIDVSNWIRDKGCKKILVVCDNSINYLNTFSTYLKKQEQKDVLFTYFSNFQSNPLYENVCDGVKLFKEQQCDSIIAVGGGSAIDVAKCIKLYGNQPGDGKNGAWLTAKFISNNIPFLAMPTTAGTGSESTHFAVIYYQGQKQSITSESIIPDTVLMDSSVLITLPLYQKKATMSDALCHAIESFWSLNSTTESKKLCTKAIKSIISNMDGYLDNTEKGRREMLMAANMAGKAINITQTTAGHAMCYKITSLYGVAHGHAALLCDRVLFPWMIDNIDKCIDPRGQKYLQDTLDELGYVMGCPDAKSASKLLESIFNKLEFTVPKATEQEYAQLKVSVNPVRLKNHPIELTVESIDELYHRILR